jgi:hypothetical protein
MALQRGYVILLYISLALFICMYIYQRKYKSDTQIGKQPIRNLFVFRIEVWKFYFYV